MKNKTKFLSIIFGATLSLAAVSAPASAEDGLVKDGGIMHALCLLGPWCKCGSKCEDDPK